MTNWLDRAISSVAPRLGLKRQRARVATELLIRHYEAAGAGRRTQGWNRGIGSDANAAIGPGLARLREQARDLVRNNPWAGSALETIVNHVVGWGIIAVPDKSATRTTQAGAAAIWKAWAGSTACDADGRLTFAGLQKLVMRSSAESGEVFVRRRFRRPEDGLPLPIQLQVLEADFLDTAKQGNGLGQGSQIIQGVEFDAIGRRTAYWLFPSHPGSSSNLSVSGVGAFGGSSRAVPASEILHVFKPSRPGQIRGPSWFANVALRLKDFDDYEDAALMKQKIAACLAVITSDIDGSSPGLGAVDPAHPEVDSLEPGMILNVPPGRAVNVVEPPTVSEHAAYSSTVLRAIAAGLGVTYEDMVGDYGTLPFSAARMSRLRHWANVEDWRWQMLIPQFCDPVWQWAMQSAVIMNLIPEAPPAVWTAPPAPMIDPTAEGLAYQRNIRSGIMTLSEAIKERGYDPDALLAEMATDNRKLDTLGLILDSDARRTTQQGSPREVPLAELAARIDALSSLVQAGFKPEGSLGVVGLKPLDHLGLPPTTVQPAARAAALSPPSVPVNGNANQNGHGRDGLELLAEVRALADQIADVVTQRLDEAAAQKPEVSAPAVQPAASIHLDVRTDDRERTTITKKTPIRDANGVIVEVLEERVTPAATADPVGQGY